MTRYPIIGLNFILSIARNYTKVQITNNEENQIFVRKNQISRAFMNILDNANKFADNIYIKSIITNNEWITHIEDNGPGTTLSQEQLIKPFFKGSSQLNQGTGLGLSIVQKLLKLNNGELKFEKSEYGGLKVIVILKF